MFRVCLCTSRLSLRRKTATLLQTRLLHESRFYCRPDKISSADLFCDDSNKSRDSSHGQFVPNGSSNETSTTTSIEIPTHTSTCEITSQALNSEKEFSTKSYTADIKVAANGTEVLENQNGNRRDSLYNELLASVEKENLLEQVERPISAAKHKKPRKSKNLRSNVTKEAGEEVLPRQARRKACRPKMLQASQRDLPEQSIKGVQQVSFDDAWKDIVGYLKQVFKKSKSGTVPKGDNKRMNVIGEKLCDDAISRLGSSLDKHVGCDIVDINPGVCLWSRKLHERLKPRTHLLLEPDAEIYEPLLKPLLEAPDSTYKLVKKSGIMWSHLDSILSKTHLPHQENYKDEDPRKDQPNNTLLLIANIGQHPSRPFRGFGSLSILVLHQFLSAIRSQSLIQRYGQVRMLIWTPDAERIVILPRVLHGRKKSSVEAELSCKDIVEVASSTRDSFNAIRTRSLKEGSLRRVLERMKDVDISTPPGRESLDMISILGHQAPALADLTGSELRVGQDAVDRTAMGSQEQQSKSPPDVLKLPELELNHVAEKHRDDERVTSSQRSDNYRPVYTLRRQNEKIRVEKVMLNFAKKFDVLQECQRQVYKADTEGKMTPKLEKKLQELTDEWKAIVASKAVIDGNPLSLIVDSRRCMELDPPLLVWDRRPFEPLKVYDTEFFPHQPMALLDFDPRPMRPFIRADFQYNDAVLDFIVSTMFTTPRLPIPRAFNTLWPGAAEWLSSECKTLTNPLKGGMLELEFLAVRCLTDEMLEDIMQAWVKWPFKPTQNEFISRMGSLIFDVEGADNVFK